MYSFESRSSGKLCITVSNTTDCVRRRREILVSAPILAVLRSFLWGCGAAVGSMFISNFLELYMDRYLKVGTLIEGWRQ